MVGQANPFIGFDKHVVGLVGSADHQVQADHWNIQCAGGADRGHDRGLMHLQVDARDLVLLPFDDAMLPDGAQRGEMSALREMFA